jgi:hypothetical protein
MIDAAHQGKGKGRRALESEGRHAACARLARDRPHGGVDSLEILLAGAAP